MLLDHADFALQEQAADNLMVAFSWAWYNGSYTMTVTFDCYFILQSSPQYTLRK